MDRQNAYSAFMLDHAAGALSDGEALVADLHRRLSPSGARTAALMEAAGGVLLESLDPEDVIPRLAPPREAATLPAGQNRQDRRGGEGLDFYLNGDLLGLPWRKTFFGVQTLPIAAKRARLLRLDPGGRAPAHGHGARDVTVVLRGSFADEFGVYERGDLCFAEPGVRHEPRALGEEPCVCLIAAEKGPMLDQIMDAIIWTGLPVWRKRTT